MKPEVPYSDDALAKLTASAVGLDTEYTLAIGERSRRIYLDSTASTLRLQVVQDVLDKYLPYYSNTHSVLHFGAKLSTEAYKWSHDMVLDFVGAAPETYTAFFVGSGATGGINRVARTLREKRPDRDVVVTSIMEHHSNDLPHRKHFREVVHVPAETTRTSVGRVNLDRITAVLQQHGERVNYVAITGVSNVTGIINPIHDVAALAHHHGALIVVDAAQMAAHLPIRMSGHVDAAHDLDVLVFSGHKIYAPGSPGVVVTRMALFEDIEPQEVGGGMVEDVHLTRYTTMTQFPDREEAGTPNICGAIGLAAALYALDKVGMARIADDEAALIRYCLEKLAEVEDIVVYGETGYHECERAGAVSFNMNEAHHGLIAAVLNDYYNIAVRNECFCAHPYVREMITDLLAEELDNIPDEELERLADLHRGMVRASFGVYTTKADVDALAAALREIRTKLDFYKDQYDALGNGDHVHKTFRFEPTDLFSVKDEVDRWLG